MLDTRSLRWAAVGLLTVSFTIFPSLARAQTGTVEVTVDAPASGATISNGQTIDIGGWAVDTASTNGTGIDSVEIFVDVDNGVAAQRIIAEYGTARPDVASAFSRPDWRESGFNVNTTVQGLADGQHTFQVWAHSTSGHWNSGSVTVSAVTRPDLAATLPPVAVTVPPPPDLTLVQVGPLPPTVALPAMLPLIPNMPAIACSSTGAVPEPGVMVVPC